MSETKPPSNAAEIGDIHPAATGTGALAPAPLPGVGVEFGGDEGQVPSYMSPLVAAFDAGRFWNRERFHLEQAWFGYGNHRRSARRVLKELGLTVRNLVPAADRRVLREAVTRPVEGLLERIESEGHHEAYEDYIGEFADGDLTDDDFRRALEPVFETLAAVRRSIEEKLDGPAGLAFELGELLDRGTCPSDVHRLLGRPCPAQPQASPPPGGAPEVLKLKPGIKLKQLHEGEPEGESRWRSVRPGDVDPAPDWCDEVRQLLIELAVGLRLPPASLLSEQAESDESTAQLVARVSDMVVAALAAPHEMPSGIRGENQVGGDPSGRTFASTAGVAGPSASAPFAPAQGAEETSPTETDGAEGGTKAAPSPSPSRPTKVARDDMMEARGKWVYEKCHDLNLTYKAILAQFKEREKEEGWKSAAKIQGIRHIAKTYAKRHGLDPPPPRQAR